MDFVSLEVLPRGFSVSARTNQLKNLQPIALLSVRVMADKIAKGTGTNLSKCVPVYLVLYLCLPVFAVM
jgi:hypothetical protein